MTLVDAVVSRLQDYLQDLQAIDKKIGAKEFGEATADYEQVSNMQQQQDEHEKTVDNDEMLLRNPMPVQRASINQLRYSLDDTLFASAPMCFLPQWFGDTMTSPNNVFDVKYTWKQVRVVIAKGILVLQTLLDTLEDAKAAKEKQIDGSLADIVALYDANPTRFGDALFALYLYSSNYSNCSCTDVTLCDGMILSERNGLVKGKYDSTSRYAQGHPVVRITPTNKAAYGYNCAIWALANWSLRLAQDGERMGESSEVVAAAKAGVEALSPFIKMVSFALNHLGSIRNILFRGIRGRVKYPYLRGDVITWPSFSSTSLDEEVAKSFMNDEGTFFIITAHSPHMINWISWYPLEAEALLNLGACFEVKGRMSNTLLSILGSNSEIITLAETGGETVSPVVEAEMALLNLKKSLFVYESYMKSYVLGYLSPSATSRIGGMDLDKLMDLFKNKVKKAAAGVGGNIPKIVIVGAGGTGKTSCMLYILSQFMSSLSVKTLSQEDQWVPLFVPLPMTSFAAEGGIDEYVLRDLRLREASFEALCSGSHQVILLLDSLDEVDFQGEEDATELVQSVLKRNPLVHRLCKGVILSSRPELFGNQNRLTPDTVFAGGNLTYHVHSFVDEDMKAFIYKAVKNAGQLEDEVERMVNLIKEDQMWNLVRNPFVLHMLVTNLLDDETVVKTFRGDLDGSGLFELYESYFAHLAKQKQVKMETLVKDAEVLAMGLHCNGISQGQVSRYAGNLSSFLQLPLRVENAYTSVGSSSNDSTFCFRHKSLQEFLVARYLYNHLLDWDGVSFVESDPWVVSGYLSKHPNVVRLFTDRLKRDTNSSVKNALGKWATNSMKNKIGASNALTVLCQSRVVLSTLFSDLRDAVIENGYLDGGVFTGLDLQNATFTRCSMRGVDLSYTQLHNLHFVDSKLLLKPSLDFSYPVSGIDCTDASDYVVFCGKSFVTFLRTESYEEVVTMSIDAMDFSFCKLSLDGKFLALRSHGVENQQSLILIYRVEDLLIKKIEPYHRLISSGWSGCFITFSYCSRYFCVLGKKLQVVDLVTGSEIYAEDSPMEYIDFTSVAFSPDSRKMVAVYYGCDFFAYDVHESKVTKIWEDSVRLSWYDLRDIQITCDGKFLIAAGNKLSAISFDRFLASSSQEGTSRPIVDKDFADDTKEPSLLHFMHGGKHVVHYHNDSLVVFDFESTSKITSWTLENCGPICANTKRNDVLIVDTSHTRIRVFNTSAGADELSFQVGHINGLTEVEFIPGKTKFLSSGLDERTFLHSSESNAIREISVWSFDAAYEYKFSPCGRLLCRLSLGRDQGTMFSKAFIRLARICPGEKFEEIFSRCTQYVPNGSFSNDGSFFAFSFTSEDEHYGNSAVNGLHIAPVEELLRTSKHDMQMNNSYGWWYPPMRCENFREEERVMSVHWSPDDSQVVVATTYYDELSIYLINPSNIEEMENLGDFDKDEVVMEFSPDGEQLYAFLVRQKKFVTFSIPDRSASDTQSGITGALFSPSRIVCALSANDTLRFMTLPEKKQLHISEQISVFKGLRKKGDAEYPIWKWSPNGNVVAVACDEGYQVAILSVEAEEMVVWGFLRSFLAPVTCVAFSSDGSKCVVGGADAVVRVFSIAMRGCALIREHPAETPTFSALGCVGLDEIAEDDEWKQLIFEHSHRRGDSKKQSHLVYGLKL